MNKEKRAAWARAYYKKNRKKLLANQRKYAKSPRAKALRKLWLKKNPGYFKKYLAKRKRAA